MDEKIDSLNERLDVMKKQSDDLDIRVKKLHTILFKKGFRYFMRHAQMEINQKYTRIYNNNGDSDNSIDDNYIHYNKKYNDNHYTLINEIFNITKEEWQYLNNYDKNTDVICEWSNIEYLIEKLNKIDETPENKQIILKFLTYYSEPLPDVKAAQ